MATFHAILPDDLIQDLEKLENNTEKMVGEMTKAGAEVTLSTVRSRVPFPELAEHCKITRTYKTPSDEGINNKVIITGYIPFKGGRKTFARRGGNKSGTVYKGHDGVPADFLAKVFEYGRSGAPFPKKPFFRSSFNHGKIEAAMKKVQKGYGIDD